MFKQLHLTNRSIKDKNLAANFALDISKLTYLELVLAANTVTLIKATVTFHTMRTPRQQLLIADGAHQEDGDAYSPTTDQSIHNSLHTRTHHTHHTQTHALPS